MTLSSDDILRIDRAHIWHPYASIYPKLDNYPVKKACGSTLTLHDGTVLIDGMSSWWSAIHGYNHPRLNQAISAQLHDMAHVMFGGLTHAPAAELAQNLVDITPSALTRVFFADSGSVAVEVALKMAVQYGLSQQTQAKTRFVSLRSGYHGDTLGAMSVCDPVTGMHHMFQHLLPHNYFVAAPACGFDQPCLPEHTAELEALLAQHHEQIAAIILEPIVQGAGGMRFYAPGYLKRVRELCTQYQVLLIADEIATGFARTGKMFACEFAEVTPDILCVGKALTGGYMTLAATLCTEQVARGICDGEAGVFMHGPTFMANPLACSVANASIALLRESAWQQTIQRIERGLREGLAACTELATVSNVRSLGAIGVVELKEPVNMVKFTRAVVRSGVWLRPFGKLVYTMPPYCISPDELAHLTTTIHRVLHELAA